MGAYGLGDCRIGTGFRAEMGTFLVGGFFYITFAGVLVWVWGKGRGGMGRACFGLNFICAHRFSRVEMNAGEHLDTSGRWRFD